MMILGVIADVEVQLGILKENHFPKEISSECRIMSFHNWIRHVVKFKNIIHK